MNRELTGLISLAALTLIWSILTYAWGGFVTGFLFYSLLFLLLYEILVYVSCVRGLFVKREISSPVLTAGQSLHVSIKLSRPYVFPFTWLILRDQNDLEKRSSLGKSSFLVENERTVDLDYKIYGVRRGRYHFNQLECTAGDLFGIVERKVFCWEPQTVRVYPEIQPVSYWLTYAVHRGNRMQRYRPNAQDVTFVSGLRNYRVGDRLQQIHWKATARGQGIKVKESEQETACEYIFVLDQDQSAYQRLPGELFERAVSLAASLIHHAISHRLVFSLVLTGASPLYVNGGRSREHLIRVLEYLVDVKPDGQLLLPALVSHGGIPWSKNKRVVLISPRIDEQVGAFLHQLRKKKVDAELFWIADSSAPVRQPHEILQQWPVWKIDQPSFDLSMKGGVWIGSKRSP
ncbi:DUF58 domain-containing protein [Lihuaxuella thermophila]|uniref:Uncharacterized conserved protein, DUF58 family, contains vWF domain n=1 Tax=Lihuaxuella thermophila TaxID=1173111 RepID=A0A1H8GA15_9BACL|nr:DUF58 domain-containing protein [Lihuaxuella thermophila]SEN40605.1 Uncharacterized conserved protein, DUF58 family, contains vWF domain [Lihuaxuella thermophila]